MKCPLCNQDAGFKVKPAPYDKTPDRTVRIVICGNCGGEYHQQITVWNGDYCELYPTNYFQPVE